MGERNSRAKEKKWGRVDRLINEHGDLVRWKFFRTIRANGA